jgi:HAD superfamily hydrolase (TIGR01549 family)
MSSHSVPTRFRAAVFDMDGLMLNTEDLYDLVGQRLLARRGLTLTAEIKRAMMGCKAGDAFAALRSLCALDEPIDDLMTESERLMDEILAPGGAVATLPGLERLLERLEVLGIPKAVATSSTRRFARRVLGETDLWDRFAFVLTGDDVDKGKPHPEIYLAAADRLGISPAEMVVLEDSVPGCRAAKAAGAFPVAVPSRPEDFRGVTDAICRVATLNDPTILRLFESV